MTSLQSAPGKFMSSEQTVLIDQGDQHVGTVRAASDFPALAEQAADEALRHVEDTLLQWYSDPDQLIDDDIEAPTAEVIKRALSLLPDIRSWLELNAAQGMSFVVRGASPSSGGCVSIECEYRGVAVVFVVEGAGKVELRVFENNRLVWRGPYRA